MQTDRTGLEEQRLVELRKDKVKLLEEVAHFRDEWALAEGNYQDRRHQVQVLQRMNQDILEKCKEILNQKVVDAGMQAEDVSLGTQRTRSRDISFSVTGVSGF